VDVTFEKEKKLEKAIKVLEIMTKQLKVFGKYTTFNFENLH
jgi:prephenate dehydratase